MRTFVFNDTGQKSKNAQDEGVQEFYMWDYGVLLHEMSHQSLNISCIFEICGS